MDIIEPRVFCAQESTIVRVSSLKLGAWMKSVAAQGQFLNKFYLATGRLFSPTFGTMRCRVR